MIWGLFLLGAILAASLQEIKCEPSIHETMLANGYQVETESIDFKALNKGKKNRNQYHRFTVKSFGVDFDVDLIRVEPGLKSPLTPIYNYSLSPDGKERFHKYDHAIEIMNTKIYEDYNTKTTLVVFQNGSVTQEFGIIESLNLVMLPQNMADPGNARRRRSSNGTDDSDKVKLYNIYSLSKLRARRSPQSAETTVTNLSTREPVKGRHGSVKRDIVLYPRILVIVDGTFFASLKHDSWRLIPYLLALFNGLDMKFRSFPLSRFKFQIAGIIIPRDGTPIPYIDANRVNIRNNITVTKDLYIINIDKVLKDMGKWVYALDENIIPSSSFNIAVTLTSYPTYLIQQDGTVANPGAMGRFNGLCQRDNQEKMSHSSVVIKDIGDWDGIHFAAHEIGHLMGFSHVDNNTCSLYQNNIMDATARYHSWSWSNCSEADFRKFLATNQRCLNKSPGLN